MKNYGKYHVGPGGIKCPCCVKKYHKRRSHKYYRHKEKERTNADAREV